MTGKCGESEEEITQQQAAGTDDYTLCGLRDLSQHLSPVYIFSLRFLFSLPLSSSIHLSTTSLLLTLITGNLLPLLCSPQTEHPLPPPLLARILFTLEYPSTQNVNQGGKGS